MSYATLDDLRSQLGSARTPEQSAAYAAKMLHPLPAATSVNREQFILEHCKGKRVLEFGASGPLHDAIVKVAASVVGVDRVEAPNVLAFDLDDVDAALPTVVEIPDVIICGEVIEHLSNPGWFLTRLHWQYAGIPTILTVPNAYSKIAASWVLKGQENVNADHVAWYSPKTISVLLQRAGYSVGGLFYYGGEGPTAEGLVVVTE